MEPDQLRLGGKFPRELDDDAAWLWAGKLLHKSAADMWHSDPNGFWAECLRRTKIALRKRLAK